MQAQAQPQTFEATPTLVGNNVKWKLCYTTPNPDECGTSNGTYPDVILGAGTGATNFKYTIVDDQTGLGIKFAGTDPLSIKKGEPNGPGTEKQIGSPGGGGTKVLTFVDKNNMPNPQFPDPVVLDYQLNFTDRNNNAVTSIDPDITNGGNPGIIDPPSVGPGGGRGISYADYAPAFAVGLIAGIVLMLLFQRMRRTG